MFYKVDAITRTEYRLERFQVLHSSDNMVTNFNYALAKFNRTTFYFNTSFDLGQVDENWKLSIEINGWMGNEFRKIIPDIENEDACSFLKTNKHVYPDLVNFSNFPPVNDDMCPRPPQHYWLANYVLDTSDLPQIPYNCKKVQAIFSCFYKNELEFKFAVTCVEDI